jgi:hypothetical protein
MSRTPLLMSAAILGAVAILAPSAQAHPPARVVPTKRLKVIYVPASGAAKQLYVVPSGQLMGSPAQPPPVVAVNSSIQPPVATEDGREQTPAAVPPQTNPAPMPSVFVVRYTLVPTVKQLNFADHDQAHELEEQLTDLGIKVEMIHQPSSFKVRYRCPTWLTAEFSDKDDAKELEESLRNLGFEAHTRAKN